MTVAMWAYSDGDREIGINDIDPKVYEKLRPVFDDGFNSTYRGRITINKNTKLVFYKKEDDNTIRNEDEVELKNEGLGGV
jgi:hypothetical protein